MDPRGTQTNLLNGRRDDARPRCRAAASTRSGTSARRMASSSLRVPFHELAGPVHHRIVCGRRLLPPARRPLVLDDRVRPHHSGEPVQPPLASTSDGIAPGFPEAIWAKDKRPSVGPRPVCRSVLPPQWEAKCRSVRVTGGHCRIRSERPHDGTCSPAVVLCAFPRARARSRSDRALLRGEFGLVRR